MKVILLKGVQKVGKRLDIVDVADGFATNHLIPSRLAELATKDAITRANKLKASEEVEKDVREALLIKNLKSLEGITLVMSGKANEQGHLFAGIHKEQLIPALHTEAQIEIDADHIVLDKPLKEIGIHEVEIKVQDKTATFKVDIRATE
ncbi:MAG: ribosomal protein large subunit ribosomal protein [Candidatus Parcubacteria bacterium]|jgi:large subunit ribosomal protein L9